eukprot:scaffold7358_cov252-Pinguiococcus_pyrenoidosus.AAC.36
MQEGLLLCVLARLRVVVGSRVHAKAQLAPNLVATVSGARTAKGGDADRDVAFGDLELPLLLGRVIQPATSWSFVADAGADSRELAADVVRLFENPVVEVALPAPPSPAAAEVGFRA